MVDDLAETLFEQMIEEDPGLKERLEQKEKDLKKLECSESKFWSFLEIFELDILVEMLGASDEYFFKKFPNMSRSFNSQTRAKFAKDIQEHATSCPRCKQKIANDRAWEAEVDKNLAKLREKNLVQAKE
ncbi:MAG TPA: hypothetical protein VGO63_02465 [Candidatus Paceibacterota bacterium]|jgi:hypothetical protein|nr:hypothetical protein [Candidatus Paceibacterota bacterium]